MYYHIRTRRNRALRWGLGDGSIGSFHIIESAGNLNKAAKGKIMLCAEREAIAAIFVTAIRKAVGT